MEIPEAVLSQMSTDQRTSYKLVQAVKVGCLPESLQYVKCGELSHARWLTTGQRTIFLWSRVHGLEKNDKKILELLARFFINFYFKLYFDIKVKHLLIDAPRHILTSLRLLRAEPKSVSKVISPFIQSGAWNAHPENLLLCLLASQDPVERCFAVDKILESRGSEEFGDESVRTRITPKLNFSATTLSDLIFWNEVNIEEPVFSCCLSRYDIEQLRHQPLTVPPFSCHTQSTERCVKLVTEAAAEVAGQNARDLYIKVKNNYRKSIPTFNTKADIMKTF